MPLPSTGLLPSTSLLPESTDVTLTPHASLPLPYTIRTTREPQGVVETRVISSLTAFTCSLDEAERLRNVYFMLAGVPTRALSG